MAHFHLIERDDGPFGFELRTPDGTVLLTNTSPLESQRQTAAMVAEVRARSVEEGSYRKLNGDGVHSFELLDEEQRVIGRGPDRATKAERDKVMAQCRTEAIRAPLRLT
ncbi:MAG TPA: hypothetical protein PLA11_12980 [Flavobacteriales bacterium]|nr:hypothetical protein [Flavobacteriales bacterium]MCB0813609.1 hypothetical protein [Flavobacteriales bacterium]MCB9179345.1 hypothetical protein [Flavobacteriales bacterium]HOP44425.1 hypothetical protein [Flavobacteriales bacterium]HPF67987.1 hypothetical protein [Flavobacteriales bacterium]